MDYQLLTIFIVLNIANVVIQTIKSLATVKCGKGLAAVVNAVAYGLYTVVVIYMVCELPLMLKAGIIALCNLVGVFIVKWAEEKMRRDRLWKVEASINIMKARELDDEAMELGLSFNHMETSGNYEIFNFYCPTQNESTEVKKLLQKYHAKYFVTESKVL